MKKLCQYKIDFCYPVTVVADNYQDAIDIACDKFLQKYPKLEADDFALGAEEVTHITKDDVKSSQY